MTRFDAYAMFCLRPDGGHSLLHPQCDPEVAPAYATALASMSGMLDTCNTQEDLDEAVKHGVSLLAMELRDQDDLHAEANAVFAEVCRWGEKMERMEAARGAHEWN